MFVLHVNVSPGSVVSVVPRLRARGSGILIPAGAQISSPERPYRLCGPTSLPFSGSQEGVFFWGVRWPGRVADHCYIFLKLRVS